MYDLGYGVEGFGLRFGGIEDTMVGNPSFSNLSAGAQVTGARYLTGHGRSLSCEVNPRLASPHSSDKRVSGLSPEAWLLQPVGKGGKR